MNHAETMKKVREMSDEALAFTSQDLKEVIEAQEPMARDGLATPKLGEYYDTLHYVVAEIVRRKMHLNAQKKS